MGVGLITTPGGAGGGATWLASYEYERGADPRLQVGVGSIGIQQLQAAGASLVGRSDIEVAVRSDYITFRLDGGDHYWVESTVTMWVEQVDPEGPNIAVNDARMYLSNSTWWTNNRFDVFVLPVDVAPGETDGVGVTDLNLSLVGASVLSSTEIEAPPGEPNVAVDARFASLDNLTPMSLKYAKIDIFYRVLD